MMTVAHLASMPVLSCDASFSKEYHTPYGEVSAKKAASSKAFAAIIEARISL